MHPTARTITPSILLSAVLLSACASGGAGRAARDETPARVARADSAVRAALAGEQSLAAVPAGRPTIAVTPLSAPAGDTVLAPLAFGLSELVAIDLAEVKAVTVVDRLRLDALLRELQFSASKRVDSATAPRVGRLLSANRIVVGAIGGDPTGTLALDVRVADAASGAISASIDARSAAARIFDAEKALVFRLLEELGVTPTPRERERIAQRRVDDLRALLAYSRGVEARILGDVPRARAQFREAARIAPSFSQARANLGEVSLGDAAAAAGDPLSRITAATAQAVNPAAPARVAESADVPIQNARQLVEFLISIRVP